MRVIKHFLICMPLRNRNPLSACIDKGYFFYGYVTKACDFPYNVLRCRFFEITDDCVAADPTLCRWWFTPVVMLLH